MGKTCKVVVCGQTGTGKTALLEQLIYGNHAVGAVRINIFLKSKVNLLNVQLLILVSRYMKIHF